MRKERRGSWRGKPRRMTGGWNHEAVDEQAQQCNAHYLELAPYGLRIYFTAVAVVFSN